MWDSVVYIALAQDAIAYLMDGISRSNVGIKKQLQVCVNDDNWKMLFVLGSILPNTVCNSGDHPENTLFGLFEYRYGICFYRPLELGYYFHLLVDDRQNKLLLKNNFRKIVFPKKNKSALQYISKVDGTGQYVFDRRKLPFDFVTKKYSNQVILQELNAIKQWIDNHTIESLIDGTDKYELSDILKKEVNGCLEIVNRNLSEIMDNSAFKVLLWCDIQNYFANCCYEFSDMLINRTDQFGWVKNRKKWKSLCWWAYVKLKTVLFGKKKARLSTREKVFEIWKLQWRQDPYYSEKDLFYPLFVEIYEFTEKKIKKNGKRNLQTKIVFLVICFFPVLLCFLNEIYLAFKAKNLSNFEYWINAQNLVILGAAALIGILFSAFVAKWIDIKKYQETLARHHAHRHKLDKEMFQYIYSIGNYNSPNKKKRFIENVFRIEDENEEKFVKNMEEKERSLNDLFDNININRK